MLECGFRGGMHSQFRQIEVANMNKTCDNPSQRFGLRGSERLCGQASSPMKNRLPIHGGSPASGDGTCYTTITSGNRLFVKNNRKTGDESEQ